MSTIINKNIFLSADGKFYKIGKDKNGEKIEREVVKCECGEYISLKTKTTHTKSKKHYEWEIRQFRPWFLLSKYKDLMVQIHKLEEEMIHITSQIHWEEEDQKVIDSEKDQEKKEKYIFLKSVFMEEDLTLENIEEGLAHMKKKRVKKSSQKKNQSISTISKEKEIQVVKEPVCMEKEEESDDSEDEIQVVKEPVCMEKEEESENERNILLVKDSNKFEKKETPLKKRGGELPASVMEGIPPIDIDPTKTYIMASDPDKEINMDGSRYLIASYVQPEDPFPDQKTFFARYGIDLEKYSQDIRNEDKKAHLNHVIGLWDTFRGSNFEETWDKADAGYFERERYVRQFPLVKVEAIILELTDESPIERLGNMTDTEKYKSYTYRKNDFYYFYNQEKNELYETEVIFPLTMEKSPSYKHGRCQVCQKWVGHSAKYPCKHAICNECHHKKKKGNNCIPQCVVCGLRYRDKWVIYLKPGETNDEEGNILKNGKIVKRYWEVEEV